MADDKARVIGTGRAGEVKSVTGSEAGKGAKYDRAAAKAEEQRYKAAHGAAGLGAARKASTPEFQKAMKAHMAKWRAARAKKAGQKTAASKLPTPKPEETP